tara:strand:- start:1702 stop:1935 length:234 start_codon:yes stop_codon:yes gene_type:complete
MKQTEKIVKHWKSRGWIAINLIKTNKNGIPDYMMLKDGKTVFVESKEPEDRLSPLQGYRIKQLKAAGFDCYVNEEKQ